MSTRSTPCRVGLFVTCLVDLFRPNIGFASIRLLEQAGCEVEVPGQQTCCGQPAFNSGDYKTTRRIARQVIEAFEAYDYVVGPSGSCMATIRAHYRDLFEDDPQWRERASRFSERAHELLSFLTDVRGMTDVDARYDGTATYHDSCSGLAGCQATAAQTAGIGVRVSFAGNVRQRGLLRLRGHLLREVPGNIHAHGDGQGLRHRGVRGEYAGGR